MKIVVLANLSFPPFDKAWGIFFFGSLPGYDCHLPAEHTTRLSGLDKWIIFLSMPKNCLIHRTPYGEWGNICHFETTLNIFKEGRGYQIDAKAPGWGSFWCSVVSHSNSAHNTPCLLTCLWRAYGGTRGVTAAIGNAGGQMWGPGFL